MSRRSDSGEHQQQPAGSHYEPKDTPREEATDVETGAFDASGSNAPSPPVLTTLSKPKPTVWPHFKFILTMIALNITIFVVEIGENGWKFEEMKVNPLVGPSGDLLLRMGAQRSDLIFQGEWWRLFTAMFLHGGLYDLSLYRWIILHLAFNMLALYQLGVELENTFDRRRVVCIYFASGLIGAMCSAVFVPDVVRIIFIGVGASGAIFGLFGATFAEFVLNWDLYANRLCHMTNLIGVAIVNLGIGLLPFVNNFAHLSGFLSGLGMGFAMLSLPTSRQHRLLNTRTPKQRLLAKIGGTITIVFALLFTILLATEWLNSVCYLVECDQGVPVVQVLGLRAGALVELRRASPRGVFRPAVY
ncbi:hypothetical protein AaE_005610 [Aphanomyces astaci]|uniref:rhomboid protease n=1 Tax=Aphanomyces astaci TaxID=112090 RepID=A0A6A5AM17_APHAT|nr:hypothetical protein AaE_005610 [Aphanomyces astaci]